MKYTTGFVILVLQSVSHSLDGARIFGAFPTPSISHQVVFRALMEELAKRGHELVVLTTDPVHYKEPEFKNFTEIDVHEMSYKIWRERFNFAMERLKDPSTTKILDYYFDIMVTISDKQLSHPDMMKLLNNPNERFDLCFIEGILPLFAAFKDRFNCSLILINSFPGIHSNYDNVGSPIHPILYFDMFNPYDPDGLDLWKKIQLIMQRLEYIYIRDWKYSSKYEDLHKKYFGQDVRPHNEIENDVDMVFQNFHPIISGIRPLVPAIVHMGSMHIKPPNPLPSNLQSALDGAHNGAIYFSLGSNVRSSDLPQEKVTDILDVLSSLPYVILWKWENDNLPNRPPNVLISKWFPQHSVLNHPNVKLFITQGGQQSMEEAIHYGVPMIGIPFLADQAGNVVRIVKLGIGKRLLIETITPKDLKDTILDITTNTSYYNNIMKLRELIYDQPQSALERAVWWTEYVIRHKGAKHLKAPATGMSSLEYYLVYDIIQILTYFVALIIVFKYICRRNFTFKKDKTS